MSIFVEFHALRSFPPSNLNRDDLGSPKTAVFGGVRRLRVSSQCLKRTWRMSETFRGDFAEEELGVRTARLPEQVLNTLGTALSNEARAGLQSLLGSLGKKAASKREEGDEDTERPDEAETPATGGDETRTAHLLFLSRQEIDAVGDFAREHAEALAALGKKKVDAKATDALRKRLEEFLVTRTSRNAVDVGLFGRFVTSDEFDTIDGALQVAHGLGTQKVEVEYDYFTAVDDLGEGPGAGHLGETEFASSVLYLYACCDLSQLEKNLGRRTSGSREPDAEAQDLARKGLSAVARAMAEATPKGKKTGTAPYTPAEYVEVVVRRGAPLSFANAFIKPVAAREHDGDVTAASIARLIGHRNRIESAYGRDRDVVARFVLCLRDVEGAVATGHQVNTLAELTAQLSAALQGEEAGV